MFDILPALVFLVAMTPRRSKRSVSRPKAADGSVIAKQVVQKREVKIKKKLDDDDVSKNKANKKCTNASTSKTLSSSSDESDDEVLLRQLVRKSTGKDKVSSSNINTSKSDPISKTPNTNVTKKNVTFAEETIVPTCNNKTNDNDISPDADATINSLNDNMSVMLAPSPNPTNTTNLNMPSQSTSTNGISKTGVPSSHSQEKTGPLPHFKPVDVATLIEQDVDHFRRLLEDSGKYVRRIKPDGNCLFRGAGWQ